MPDGRHATVRDHDVHAGQPVELVTGRRVGTLCATARGAIEVDDDATVPIVDFATERQDPLDVPARDPALLHAGARMVGKHRRQRRDFMDLTCLLDFDLVHGASLQCW